MEPAKLESFIGQLLGDLGGAFGIALVRMGLNLGLYTTLHREGPLTARALAERTGLAERYLREWLSYNAASNYLAYDAATQAFSLPPEQAAVLADETSAYYMADAYNAAAAYLDNQPAVERAFHTGAGVPWGNQSGCLFCAVARFFRPGYSANIVSYWLPALDGVVARLQGGGRVADVGCGHGYSTMMMAAAFPDSEFVGYDFHPASVEQARKHAGAHGAPPNVRFEVARAQDFPGTGYDLVTCFDCLHDMGDPAGAAAHVRQALKPGGAWMVVEPFAHDALEDNLNPVSRLYYAASTMVCVPTSLAQEVGAALGAQAGEKRLTAIIASGGFASVRKAAQTPINMVLEARA